MERTKTFSWQDPTIGATEALQMEGMDYLTAMYDGKLPGPPIMHTLDFKMHSIESGKAIFSFVPQEFHYNPIGSVHGGVISTLLDSAMGCTVHTLMPKGKAYTTLELKVNFLKAITKKSGELFAVGKMIYNGGRTALVEAQIIDSNNKIFAYGVSTCLIFDVQKQ
ncbi:MAG: PaaI family thioesterase [Chitinophagales bacterium]